jgi:hypothetical protein
MKNQALGPNPKNYLLQIDCMDLWVYAALERRVSALGVLKGEILVFCLIHEASTTAHDRIGSTDIMQRAKGNIRCQESMIGHEGRQAGCVTDKGQIT